VDLLTKLLAINPNRRLTAEQALNHPYFNELRDSSDEPKLKPFPPCDFEFEQYNLNTQQLKDVLYE
jgi:serine/threonine protein kinase